MQFNAYRYLLQRYHGHTISGMFVVCLRPDNYPEPFVDQMPVMEAAIEYVSDLVGWDRIIAP